MNPELWRTQPWLALASLLPIPLGLAWMLWARSLPGLRGRPALAGWLTWLLTRAAFAWLVWGVLGHMGEDQRGFYLPQARAALAGQVPYRDFPSAYGPLFAPLLGLCVAAFGDTGPMILFLLADLVTWRVLAANEGEASEAVWTWVALPLVWYLGVRYAQDEPLAACFVALAWWGGRRAHPVLGGLAFAAGALVTKPLFLMLALPFALARGRRTIPALVSTALPLAAVYLALALAGAAVWQPLVLEGRKFGVGPTLWHLPASLWGVDPGLLGWQPFALLSLYGAWWLRRQRADAAAHGAWQFAAFAAFAPKFMPMYAVIWMPFLAVWAAREPARLNWLRAYGVLLPLAWYLDSGPLQGLFGPAWRAVAIAGLFGIALLSLWPIWALHRRSPGPVPA